MMKMAFFPLHCNNAKTQHRETCLLHVFVCVCVLSFPCPFTFPLCRYYCNNWEKKLLALCDRVLFLSFYCKVNANQFPKLQYFHFMSPDTICDEEHQFCASHDCSGTLVRHPLKSLILKRNDELY